MTVFQVSMSYVLFLPGLEKLSKKTCFFISVPGKTEPTNIYISGKVAGQKKWGILVCLLGFFLSS